MTCSTESGVCYDESAEVCRAYAEDGKCKNGGLHQYGNHCKKSCGLCSKLLNENATLIRLLCASMNNKENVIRMVL